MLSFYLFYSITLCCLPWRSKQPSSLATKCFWCLKSPSKISGFNNFPLALLPFGNRMTRTQKQKTSKLLSAEQSGSLWEPAEQGHLISLSDPRVRTLHTNAWLICQFALMSVQLSTAIPNEELVNGFPALQLSERSTGFRIKWILEPDTLWGGLCTTTCVTKILKNYLSDLWESCSNPGKCYSLVENKWRNSAFPVHTNLLLFMPPVIITRHATAWLYPSAKGKTKPFQTTCKPKLNVIQLSKGSCMRKASNRSCSTYASSVSPV